MSPSFEQETREDNSRESERIHSVYRHGFV